LWRQLEENREATLKRHCEMWEPGCGLTPLRARAPRGERARGSAPRNRGKNTTLLASMSAEGMGPCAAAEGATTKAVFEAYVEQVLAPALSPG
jgi:hypothetical protein